MRRSNMMRLPDNNMLLLLAAIAIFGASSAAPSRASDTVAATTPSLPASFTDVTSYIGDAASVAEGYWEAATNTVRSWFPSFSTGSMLKRHLQSGNDQSEASFRDMMGAAGYSIKSINMGVGLVPKFSLYFGQKREMSTADHVYLQRLLRKHARTESGPVAVAQRMIIQTIEQLQDFRDYDLTKVSVTMLPVPYVEFAVEPKDITLDPEMSYVAQRIKDLNLRLEALSN